MSNHQVVYFLENTISFHLLTVAAAKKCQQPRLCTVLVLGVGARLRGLCVLHTLHISDCKHTRQLQGHPEEAGPAEGCAVCGCCVAFLIHALQL